MKTLILAIAAVLLTAAPAAATRPVPGYDYPDVCKNRGAYAMPGEQTILDVLGWQLDYVDPDQEPNKVGRRDCVRIEVRH